MYKIIKRDGKEVDFDLSKITGAIEKAFIAQEREYNSQMIDLLAMNAVADVEKKAKDGKVDVESIQDSVETTLQRMGYEDVAKAYILYRNQREKIRNMNSALLNYKSLVDSYVKIDDWRVKENSTVTYSVGGLILSNSGAITANYWLSEIYDKDIAD
ncbi:MAG: ribonucleoside triphosphate reductase, partial [Clostridiales bacterium]|nr:ribonucleoside triphosphate reductase [Clostridiales bacterium]